MGLERSKGFVKVPKQEKPVKGGGSGRGHQKTGEGGGAGEGINRRVSYDCGTLTAVRTGPPASLSPTEEGF